jgi:predicted RNase H-like HicB family nuclease
MSFQGPGHFCFAVMWMLRLSHQTEKIGMLIDYIQATMRKARYEMLGNREGFAATIPGFKGLVATAPTLEACRNELQDVLQSWMLIRMDHGLRLPVVDGIDLNPDRAAPPSIRKRSTARQRVA